MRLFSRSQKPTRQDDWAEFAARLELTDASDRERLFHTLLNVPPASEFGGMYELTLAEYKRVYLLDYFEERTGPTGSVQFVNSVCMLRSKEPISSYSLKAQAKLHVVMESLGASATGSQVLRLHNDPAFNERVTIYARDDSARSVFSEPVKQTLLRALFDRGVTPTFILSEQHMLLTCRGQSPTDLTTLELLLSDLLSLYAAVTAL